MAPLAADHIDQLVAGVPVLLFTVLLLFVLWRYFSAAAAGAGGGGQSSRLPPSPPALPLIGHLHLIGALPHVSLRRLAARHGREDLMALRFGTVPYLVASSPRAAEAVLRAHDRSFASRPRSVVGDVVLYGPADVGFAPYGERWRQAKRLVTTHLLSARKVQSYRAAREEEVAAVVAKVRHAAGTGTAVDMSDLLSMFANDVVCRAVAGRSFRADGRDKVIRGLIFESAAVLGGFNLENFYPGPAKVAGGVLMWTTRRRAEKLRDGFDQMLHKLIDEHLSKIAENGGHQQDDAEIETDFIDMLLALQEEYELTQNNIKGILVDMLAAGTETAYLILEYAMAQLMLNQDVMTKLQDEVRSCTCNKGCNAINEDDLTKMTYLKAVIKETHRLHPPCPLLLPRLSREECVIDGYTIPAGTTTFINAWAIGRDPKIWDAPERFMPERFIRGGEIAGYDFRGKDYEFIPFGSGRRMCPGVNFALANVEILLANLLYHFDWKLPQGVKNIDMSEVFGLTVCRKEKLLLTPLSQDTM